MLISLLIPTYNREELLVQCLQCAFRQDFHDYEIIVVDQTRQHKPETRQFLDENQTRFRLITSEKPSLTAARNLGLQHARGEVIVFIDDDTEFEPDFLRAHYQAHQRGLEVVQGRIIERHVPPQSSPSWLTWYLKFKGGDDCPTDGPVNVVTGANFSVSRSVFDKIGTFDESFAGVAVHEDADFGLRAFRAGCRMGYVAAAELIHHASNQGGVDSGIEEKFFNLSYHQCSLLFARKHFPKPIVLYFRTRLILRGLRSVKKLIRQADRQVMTQLNH
ncbi:glycosyltransferase family 2 protein [Larkinella rosea]|uniref:Glycosyltransferase family 2 protein n=1 Tax=Larkinella rosea TaxID=2025312 RepID=A0A3P1BW33_9BACT|nr:glycosyltransferase family A protein [Larkinella rosea]RRB04914.1 glycosyltransferase family 2 protein [Larkinella rosea]